MWKCGSTKGGETRLPAASTIVPASASIAGSIAAMRSPVMPMSAVLPSVRMPPLTTMSNAIVLCLSVVCRLRLADDEDEQIGQDGNDQRPEGVADVPVLRAVDHRQI